MLYRFSIIHHDDYDIQLNLYLLWYDSRQRWREFDTYLFIKVSHIIMYKGGILIPPLIVWQIMP